MSAASLRARASNFISRIKKGAILNVMVNAVSALGLGFASFFFLAQGLELYKIILVWAIGPLASLPVVVFVRNWDTKKFLKLGVLAYIGMALSLLFYNQYSYILFAIFEGLKLGLFWVSFNYAFFRNAGTSRHAKYSSVYFLLGPLVGILMPPLGALLIDGLGFQVLFLATALAFLLPLLYIQGTYFNHTAHIKFSEANKAFGGIRLIAFFDGALHFFQGNFLTIYALLFLKSEYEFGGLLSYLALLSLVVSFALSYASDRYHKRVEFLFPLLMLMAITISVMPTLDSLAMLVPVIGIYAVLDNLSLPIRFAVHMDMAETDIGFWRASEFWGNTGRTIVFAISALLLYLGNFWLPFVIFAVMTAAFPFIIRYKLARLKRVKAPARINP